MRFHTLILAAALLAACSKQASQAPDVAKPGATPPAAAPSADAAPSSHRGGKTADEFFDRKNYPDAVEGTFIDPKQLSASEQKYGVAPKRDPRVTYQDGLVLMEHGDQALRSTANDGITFSFDAKAEHVDEFQEGKIIFATGRVVGRIGQLEREGDTVTVKLAPVQITDVIRDGQFVIDSTVDPSQMQVFTAPDFPQVIDQSDPPSQTRNEPGVEGGRMIQASFIRTQLPSQLGKNLIPVPANIPPLNPMETIDLSQSLKAVPLHGIPNEIGVSYNYNKGGIHVDARGELMVGKPKVRFLLLIKGATIDTFGIEIVGSLGLRMGINASSDTEKFINAKVLAVPAFDISIPCPIAGVPLSFAFHTSFALRTGFSAKRSVLDASGEYTLSGRLFAGWQGGGPSYDYPSTKPVSKLVENVSGVSLGINSLGGDFNIRPMIGIGAFGFTTGVYVGVGFSGNAIQQSSAAIACRGADLTGSIDSGVGYQLNGPLKTLINTVLRIFSSYQIEGTGTLIKGPGGQFVKLDEDQPTGCAGFSGGAAGTKT